MARKPRYRIAGIAQLITQRGNNNQAVFFSEQDYLYYLSILNEAAIKEDCQIHAFVLMSNYIHILSTPTAPDGISQLMKTVGQRYVAYINRMEKRTGTLWDGRYKASLVESGRYLLNCMHYIETAPVRSSVAKIPKKYRWSSYLFNAEGYDTVVKITPHDSYTALIPFLDKNKKETQEKYKKLLREQLGEEKLQTIHIATNNNIIYGSQEFKENIS